MRDRDSVKNATQKGLLIKRDFSLKNGIQSSFQRDVCLGQGPREQHSAAVSLFGAQVGDTEREREIHKGGRWEGPMAMQCGSHAKHQNQQVEASTIGISCSEQKQCFE